MTLAATDAAEAVIGACLLSPAAVEQVIGLLTPADFERPNSSAAFSAIIALHARGMRVDPLTVEAETKSQGLWWEHAALDLVGWQANVPNTAAVRTYAALVAQETARRGLRGLARELEAGATDPTVDPRDLADQAAAFLAQADSPALARPPGDVDIADFVAEQETTSACVIPRLLNADDRVILVAPEGKGKSVLLRQLCVCTAYGIHPFRFTLIDPRPVLLVDLENPRELVRSNLRFLTNLCAQHSEIREGASLWHRPGGIDLRRRSDRISLEDVLRRRRPSLVALGPFYKAYGRRANESDEQVAAEVQTILDDLRTRFSFALVLEHHAPQSSGGFRDLRPFGSSLWLRWPEFGLKLVPADGDVLQVGRWRGDRLDAEWPKEFHRSGKWPWVGKWT